MIVNVQFLLMNTYLELVPSSYLILLQISVEHLQQLATKVSKFAIQYFKKFNFL